MKVEMNLQGYKYAGFILQDLKVKLFLEDSHVLMMVRSSSLQSLLCFQKLLHPGNKEWSLLLIQLVLCCEK